MSKLPDFFIEKAKNELREDENRKQQSIEQCREWSLKHPFISITDPKVLCK